MNDSITLEHGLPYFCVTKEPQIVPTVTGREMYVTEGIVILEPERACRECGGRMYLNGGYTISIRDLDVMGRHSLLKVRVSRSRCTVCGRSWRQPIPFSDEDHLVTERFRDQLQGMMNSGMTLTQVSKKTGVHPYTLYQIDRKFLAGYFEGYRPLCAPFVGIDEFLLHDGHRYATVVVDLDTGEILFMEEGKRKQQAKDFFAAMGDAWMGCVLAVAMDMNAQYDSAFREEWPHIAVVYDFFHMVRLYNDSVITKLRRRIQNECRERGDEDGYQLLKGSRFLLLSSMETLRKKDSEARENNERLNRDYRSRNLELPPGERIQGSFREKTLKEILAKNEVLQVAYLLLEQFKLAYSVKDEEGLRSGFEKWFRLADQSGVPEIITFKETVEKRLDGIVSHARFRIDSGKVEGTNNLIKTTRRNAYGFKDTEYFFLKCRWLSKRDRFRYKSHKTL